MNRTLLSAAFGALASLLLLTSGTAHAAYPDRPVQMIIPVAPGGGSDLIIRVIEKDFQKEFGQPLSFVYKPGASGAVGVSELKTLPPDGYTLCSQSYPHIIIQELSGSGKYTVNDFDYIGMVAVDDVFFAVKKNSPYKTAQDVIKAAKEKPNTLTVATTDTMGCAHMAALSLNLDGVPVNIIPYSSGSKAVAALLGGQVDAAMLVKGSAAPSLSKMNLLAVCNIQRDPTLPDVPTFKEAAGLEIVQFNGRLILAPKGLPADVYTRLREGFKKIYADPAAMQRIKSAGFTVRPADGDTVLKMFENLRPDAIKLLKLAEENK